MFLMIWGVSAFQLRSKIDKKASQDRSKFKQKIGEHLDPFFDGFGDQLGSILGGFWRPSWSHVGTKWHQNPTPKPIKKTTAFQKASRTNFNEFVVDFGSNLEGGGPTNRLFGDLLALGAKMRPRPLQEPHKTPQELPRAQF